MLLAASFALATPVGILLGAAISVSQMGAWSHLLMAAAAGTFVYVALCEVIEMTHMPNTQFFNSFMNFSFFHDLGPF